MTPLEIDYWAAAGEALEHFPAATNAEHSLSCPIRLNNGNIYQ